MTSPLPPPPEVLRLMIVDDNARTRSALAAFVSGQEDMRIIGDAVDGQDVLDKLQIQFPDVVLMDCRMPRMTGLDATRAIKRCWPFIKVVVLTLYPDCQKEAISAGADAALLKGCTSEELLSTLRAVAAK